MYFYTSCTLTTLKYIQVSFVQYCPLINYTNIFAEMFCSTAPRAPLYWLPTAPGVCALGWVKSRAQISLLVIFCIIVYVTNNTSSFSSTVLIEKRLYDVNNALVCFCSV